MADPQGPILVLEGDEGVCTFPTLAAAVSHSYGASAPPREFFDASGRRLEPARDARPCVEVKEEEDQDASVRARVRYVLEGVARQPKPFVPEDFVSALSDLLQREPDLTIDQFIAELAELVGPRPQAQIPPVLDTVGTWGHYATSAHH